MWLICLSSFLLLLSSCGASNVHYSGPGVDNPVVMSHHRYTRQGTPNIENSTTMDHHIYYTSNSYPSGSTTAQDLWFDIASLNETEIIPETGISNLFRVYDVHPLPFDFQFYGHTINVIAVTTGGFLYTSDFVHSRIHLTQYIAPLQADFNPGLNDSARVLVHSSAERFTVQWDGVHVNNHVNEGSFTFQVSLFRNGTIHFVYREIPLLVSEITTNIHPVEVGLADSFYVDRPIPPNLILRQVYEYSRIQLDTQRDLSFSAFVLDPVPNCVPAQTCESCVMATQTSLFSCGWCSQLNRCSDGVDRFRQEWVEAGCSESSTSQCKQDTSPTSSGGLTLTATVGISAGLVILVLILLVASVGVCVCVVVYGYKHPTSSLGLFMIEHRPKARSLNKSKASYDVNTGKTNLSED